jgi:hypothetical protein
VVQTSDAIFGPPAPHLFLGGQSVDAVVLSFQAIVVVVVVIIAVAVAVAGAAVDVPPPTVGRQGAGAVVTAAARRPPDWQDRQMDRPTRVVRLGRHRVEGVPPLDAEFPRRVGHRQGAVPSIPCKKNGQR